MNFLNHKLALLYFVFFHSVAGALILPPMDLDFGLFSTDKPLPQHHLLPYCDDIPLSLQQEEMIRKGECLGEIGDSRVPIYVVSEEALIDRAVIRLARVPGLMSLSQFLKICRPMGGVISPDGLECKITRVF